MLIAIYGESCTGKSVSADFIAKHFQCKIYTGKDYLKLAKSEQEALQQFILIMNEHADSEAIGLIYVISELEQLKFVPEKAVRIYLKADIQSIKERFSSRMNGFLPPPVANMLEKKHGIFEDENYDYILDSSKLTIEEMNTQLLHFLLEQEFLTYLNTEINRCTDLQQLAIENNEADQLKAAKISKNVYDIVKACYTTLYSWNDTGEKFLDSLNNLKLTWNESYEKAKQFQKFETIIAEEVKLETLESIIGFYHQKANS